jgi:hypothetical protein
MKRRVPKRSINGHASHSARPANHCRALVPVDGTGIRKKVKKDYEKALRDLDKSRQQLDQFQKTDLPQFTRWLNSHFGELLTELRELSRKMAEDEALIIDVENEVRFRSGSYARAYLRVMEFRENPLPANGNGEESRKAHDSGPQFEGGSGENVFEGLFDRIFGGLGQGGERGLDGQPEVGASISTSGRLKELYRALVRLLHPDIQQEMTAQKTEWWHQAQAAYETEDVEQLEVILTLCEIGDSGTTAHTSLSLLQRITAQLKSSLREIKRQIAVRRRDLAWDFSRRVDRDTMAAQLRRGMTGDLEMMRGRWRQMQEMIAEWKLAAERLKKTRRTERQPQGVSFTL